MFWRETCQIVRSDGQVGVLGDDLVGRAFDRDERRPKRLMVTNQLAETTLECAVVERTENSDGRGNVEGGLPGCDLIEKPEGLLGKGETLWLATVSWLDRNVLALVLGTPCRVDSPGHRSDGWRLEERTEGNIHAHRFAKARNDLCRQE